METWKLRAAIALSFRRPGFVLGSLRGPHRLAKLRRNLDLGISQAIQDRYFRDHPEGLAHARGFDVFLQRKCHVFSARVIHYGDCEPLTSNLITSLVKPSSTFVDIGANIGWFSLLAASRGAKVFAYEPEPGNVELLKRSVEKNGFKDADVSAVAIGDRDGTVPLWLSEESAGWHSTVEQRGSRMIEVPCRTLDSLFPTERLDLVKIDTEGAEPQVLAGAARLIAERRMTTLVMEWNPGSWKDHAALLEPYDVFLMDGTTRFRPGAPVPEQNLLLRLRQ